jgi:hypothetical protein
MARREIFFVAYRKMFDAFPAAVYRGFQAGVGGERTTPFYHWR